ncbi:hypothetical protein ACOMHN_014654 [Nucella lapillus]
MEPSPVPLSPFRDWLISTDTNLSHGAFPSPFVPLQGLAHFYRHKLVPWSLPQSLCPPSGTGSFPQTQTCPMEPSPVPLSPFRDWLISTDTNLSHGAFPSPFVPLQGLAHFHRHKLVPWSLPQSLCPPSGTGSFPQTQTCPMEPSPVPLSPFRDWLISTDTNLSHGAFPSPFVPLQGLAHFHRHRLVPWTFPSPFVPLQGLAHFHRHRLVPWSLPQSLCPPSGTGSFPQTQTCPMEPSPVPLSPFRDWLISTDTDLSHGAFPSPFVPLQGLAHFHRHRLVPWSLPQSLCPPSGTGSFPQTQTCPMEPSPVPLSPFRDWLISTDTDLSHGAFPSPFVPLQGLAHIHRHRLVPWSLPQSLCPPSGTGSFPQTQTCPMEPSPVPLSPFRDWLISTDTDLSHGAFPSPFVPLQGLAHFHRHKLVPWSLPQSLCPPSGTGSFPQTQTCPMEPSPVPLSPFRDWLISTDTDLSHGAFPSPFVPLQGLAHFHRHKLVPWSLPQSLCPPSGTGSFPQTQTCPMEPSPVPLSPFSVFL